MARKHKIFLIDFEPLIYDALANWFISKEEFEPVKLEHCETSDDDLMKSAAILILSQNEETENLLKKYPESSIIIIGTEAFDNGNIINIKKPVRFGVLEAKIKILLRLKSEQLMQSLDIMGYKLNISHHSLLSPDGSELKLTDKEAEILIYLNQAKGSAVSREELLREVWRYNDGITTHTLETHIYRLRQKLNQFIGTKDILHTEDGGYSLRV